MSSKTNNSAPSLRQAPLQDESKLESDESKQDRAEETRIKQDKDKKQSKKSSKLKAGSEKDESLKTSNRRRSRVKPTNSSSDRRNKSIDGSLNQSIQDSSSDQIPKPPSFARDTSRGSHRKPTSSSHHHRRQKSSDGSLNRFNKEDQTPNPPNFARVSSRGSETLMMMTILLLLILNCFFKTLVNGHLSSRWMLLLKFSRIL